MKFYQFLFFSSYFLINFLTFSEEIKKNDLKIDKFYEYLNDANFKLSGDCCELSKIKLPLNPYLIPNYEFEAKKTSCDREKDDRGALLSSIIQPGTDTQIAKGVDITPSANYEIKPKSKPEKIKKNFFELNFGNNYFEFSNRLLIQGLYGYNLSLINDANNIPPELDETAWVRTIWDIFFKYVYGKESKGYDVVRARAGLRTISIWGDEASGLLSVQLNDIKLADTNFGVHNHNIARSFFWVRELWLEISLREAFCTKKSHSLMMGFFPFSVGRGISFGDAYVINTELLGDATPFAIDEYAPGIKLSGELICPCVLNYDLYFEISESKMTNFDEINDPIFKNAFGRKDTPQRGFTDFNYFLVGRLCWQPYNLERLKMYLEPYAVFNRQAEQTLGFVGRADLSLYHFGLAGEFQYGDFEFGFDGAFNFGKQRVKGWDNNSINIERNISEGKKSSILTEQYSRVGAHDILGFFHTVPITDDVKKAVESYNKQGEIFNSQLVAVVDGVPLFNSAHRFIDPYVNDIYGGFMFVWDAAYNFKFINHDIKVAFTNGVASGDDDPNKNLFLQSGSQLASQHVFEGFVPQQELYAGKRVKSIFFMSGQGLLPRPLSIPATAVLGLVADEIPVIFPSAVFRFTNIILTGAALQFKFKTGEREWSFWSNLIGFWAYKRAIIPSFFFDQEGLLQLDISKTSGRYYGTEWNVILETELYKDLKMTLQGAAFFPGSFYKSIAGVPLSDIDQQVSLFGTIGPRGPSIGFDPAYFINLIFEYKF